MNAAEPRYATSADGTRIAYWCTGQGDPILIVHGLGSTHTAYEPLAEALSKGLLACNMDRRGRGESGDTLPYALEREFEDVAAVAAQLERVVVLGYSFGGPAAIEAARASGAVRALILFESWASPLSEIPEEEVKEVERLISLGRQEDAFNYGDPPEEIERTRQLPDYAERVAIVPLAPRENRGWNAYWRHHPVDDERWGALDKPVLFLISEETATAYWRRRSSSLTACPTRRSACSKGSDTGRIGTHPISWPMRSGTGSRAWAQTDDRPRHKRPLRQSLTAGAATLQSLPPLIPSPQAKVPT